MFIPSALSCIGCCVCSSLSTVGMSIATLFNNVIGISSHAFCSTLYAVSPVISFVYVSFIFVCVFSNCFCTYTLAGINIFVPSINEFCS